jgi:GTPase Era involved in 16S rRNA processing
MLSKFTNGGSIMPISQEAGEEVKQVLENFLDEEFNEANKLFEIQDVSDHKEFVRTKFLKPFQDTCSILGVKLKSYDKC